MLLTSFVAALLGILGVSAQVLQCPYSFPGECQCYNTDDGPQVTCVTIPMDTWDMQATFDAVSDAFNNTTNELVYHVVIDTYSVTASAQEVPAHSISTLKTQILSFYTADKYTRIDPDAFSGTYSTTTDLTIFDMDFQDVEEAFDLFNNFKVLRELYIYSTLPQIPAHAFSNDLQNLTSISIRDSGLYSIGYLPFVELRNLSNIQLDGNNLSLANISDKAFTFSSTGISLNLERNPGITHLPERKFGNFLKGNENSIFVGHGHEDSCDLKYFLQCDERIDWICEAGITRIYGYRCVEIGHTDIYDYCEQKFGNSPLYRENLEEIKKIQKADRLRYEELKIEDEFRRRSYAINKAKHQNQVRA